MASKGTSTEEGDWKDSDVSSFVRPHLRSPCTTLGDRYLLTAPFPRTQAFKHQCEMKNGHQSVKKMDTVCTWNKPAAALQIEFSHLSLIDIRSTIQHCSRTWVRNDGPKGDGLYTDNLNHCPKRVLIQCENYPLPPLPSFGVCSH